MDEQTFSREYLDILAENIPLENETLGSGDSIDRIGLRNDLQQLFRLYTDDALNEIRKMDPSRTAFHFGPSDSISETLRCAPLYSEHVVTQDLLFRQLKYGPPGGGKLLDRRLFRTAKEVHSWRGFVERGDVSIVPHPLFWDEAFRDEYVQLDSNQKLYAPPLYAEGALGVTPMTDSMVVSTQFYNFVGSERSNALTGHIDRSELEGQFDPQFLADRIEGRPDEVYSNMDVIDLLPRLLGLQGGTGHQSRSSVPDQLPDLLKLDALDSTELEQKREVAKGFREEIYDVIDEAQTPHDADDLDGIILSAGEQVQRAYREMVRDVRSTQVSEIKSGLIRSAGASAVTASIPLLYGVTTGDLYSALMMPETYLSSMGAGAYQLLDGFSGAARAPSDANPIFTVFHQSN